jgi:hypothetical protein
VFKAREPRILGDAIWFHYQVEGYACENLKSFVWQDPNHIFLQKKKVLEKSQNKPQVSRALWRWVKIK